MLDHLRRLNADADPLGSFGAVVGATIGETGEDLDINGPLLVPGFGAQGGTVDDLRPHLRRRPPAGPCRAPRARCCRPGRTCRALRDAALRGNDGRVRVGRVRILALVLAAGLVVATGCSGDPHADYCEAVEDHQVELTEIAASDDTGSLFDALPVYDDLAEEAPDDIADEWDQVIGPLRALEEVLDEAGVDPSTYDAERAARRPRRGGAEGHRGRRPRGRLRADGDRDGRGGAARPRCVRDSAVALITPTGWPDCPPRRVLTRLTRTSRTHPKGSLSWPCPL